VWVGLRSGSDGQGSAVFEVALAKSGSFSMVSLTLGCLSTGFRDMASRVALRAANSLWLKRIRPGACGAYRRGANPWA
jgi:hypothetical protein